jgi:hypothetical protein
MLRPQDYQPKPHGRKGPAKLRLADPRNVNSQLGPQDFLIPDYNPDIHLANPEFNEPGHDLAVIRMMTDRITSAINYKRVKEPKWYESLAFYLGTQDVTWNYRARQLVPMRNTTNVYKSFSSRNKIRRKVKKLTYQAFAQKPDAAIKPANMSDLARQAAAEGRDLLSHLDYKFHRDQQTRRLGHWALITGTSALKIQWNEHAAAEMPDIDGAGNIVGSSIVEGIGDVHETIVPIFELLMDSEARDYNSLGWIIHQKIYDLSYIRENWENGKFVEPDTGQGIAGYVESRLAAVLGEYMRGTEPGPVKQNTAVVYECFEPPTDIYPNGRFIVCSMKVLLQYTEEWPNMDAKKLAAVGIRVPYAFMNYEECPGSLYGIGVVVDMLGPQRTINEAVSRQEDHMRTAWGKLLVEEGSRVPANAWDDARPNEKITYARGSAAPQAVSPPALPTWMLELKQEAEADLDDVSGLHEVSDAQVPNGVESGEAITQLKAADGEMGSMFAANIEEFHRQRATLEIHIAGSNYIEPRLIWVGQGYFGDPAKKMKIPGAPPPAAGAGMSQAPLLPAQAPQPMPPGLGPMPPNSGGTGLPPSIPPQAGGGQTGPMPPGGQEGVEPPLPPFVGDTDSPAMNVKSFKALQNGGSCYVEIKPGSALAKDPEAEKREIMALFKEGLFGPPGDPTTVGIVLSLLDYAGSDEIVDAVRAAQEERIRFQMAMAPNPAGVEAQRQQGALALDQAKGEREIALENAKQQHEGAVLALKAQLDQEKMERQQQNELMQQRMEQSFTLHQALLDKLHPEVRLTGVISPVETAGAMATIGFPTPDMPQLQQSAAAQAATDQATAQNTQKMADAPLPIDPNGPEAAAAALTANAGGTGQNGGGESVGGGEPAAGPDLS